MEYISEYIINSKGEISALSAINRMPRIKLIPGLSADFIKGVLSANIEHCSRGLWLGGVHNMRRNNEP